MTTTPEALPHEPGCAGIARFAWSDCPCGVLRRSLAAARAQPCTHADAERLREALRTVLALTDGDLSIPLLRPYREEAVLVARAALVPAQPPEPAE